MDQVQKLVDAILRDPSYGTPWSGDRFVQQVVSNTNSWHLSPKQRKLVQRFRGSDTMAVIRQAHRLGGCGHFRDSTHAGNEERLERVFMECVASYDSRLWHHDTPAMRQIIRRMFGGDGYFKEPREDLPLGQWGKGAVGYSYGELQQARAELSRCEEHVVNRLAELGLLTKGWK